MPTKPTNSVPTLLGLRHLTLAKIAERLKVSRALVDAWREGRYQPKPEDRAALVQAVRDHADELMRLAAKVQGEGKDRPEGPSKTKRR